jgi:hypothetical protein
MMRLFWVVLSFSLTPFVNIQSDALSRAEIQPESDDKLEINYANVTTLVNSFTGFQLGNTASMNVREYSPLPTELFRRPFPQPISSYLRKGVWVVTVDSVYISGTLSDSSEAESMTAHSARSFEIMIENGEGRFLQAFSGSSQYSYADRETYPWDTSYFLDLYRRSPTLDVKPAAETPAYRLSDMLRALGAMYADPENEIEAYCIELTLADSSLDPLILDGHHSRLVWCTQIRFIDDGFPTFYVEIVDAMTGQRIQTARRYRSKEDWR